MEKLTNKVKTFYGWDIYELTEDENRALLPGCGRKDTPARSYGPGTCFVFEQGENFDTVEPQMIFRNLRNAMRYCRMFPLNPSANKHFTIEELQSIPEGEWVWIEVLKPFDFAEKVSAYYRKQYDYTHGRGFTCGCPGLSFSFDYADYNDTWTAYLYRPE